MLKSALGAVLGALVLAGFAGRASAQQEEDLIPATRSFVSPESFVLELRLGPYSPEFDENDAFSTYFHDDNGLLLALELDYIVYRVPEVVYLVAGGGIGWADYSGKTLTMAGDRSSEDTSLEMIPLNLLAGVRIDVLPRKLGIPFIFTGKIGWQWAHWAAESGGQDDESGWSLGWLYGAQVALDLDTFEPAKARILDEEWGINHSFLFFEMFRFEPTSKSLGIGDFTWTAGLGFVF